MKPITVIIGPQASGKTTKLWQLLVGKNYTLISDFDSDNPFLYSLVSPQTEVIAVDEAHKMTLDHLQQLATSTKIFVMKRGHESQMIDRPEFVIVSQTWKHEDLINLGSAAYSRLTVIDLYK